MLKFTNSKVEEKANKTASKQLFTPLTQKEQETISGGGRRSRPGRGG